MLDLLMNGFRFGVIDNAIVIGGIIIVAWFAIRKLPEPLRLAAWKTTIGCAFVASWSNAASDLVGCLGDPTMIDAAPGITAGCLSLTVLLLIPMASLKRQRVA